MRPNMTQRDERIDLRVSADLKTLLSRAAAYSGMPLSSFSPFCRVRPRQASHRGT